MKYTDAGGPFLIRRVILHIYIIPCILMLDIISRRIGTYCWGHRFKLFSLITVSDKSSLEKAALKLLMAPNR